jgi:hypothetical protein
MFGGSSGKPRRPFNLSGSFFRRLSPTLTLHPQFTIAFGIPARLARTLLLCGQ